MYKTDLDEILEERGNAYGDFNLNVHSRGRILDILQQIHIDKTGNYLQGTDLQAINDIVIKLVRLGATPDHLDSWNDIAGYARLNIERLIEK